MAAALNETSTKFAGDADGLLDRLIVACQQKPVVTVTHAGYGRELVPYFGEDDSSMTLVPRQHSDRRRSRTSPPKKAVCSQVASSAGSNVATTSSGRSSPRQVQADRAPVLPPSSVLSGLDVSKCFSVAGPGFFVSPKPEAVPLPTSGLLTRAISPKQMHMNALPVLRAIKV